MRQQRSRTFSMEGLACCERSKDSLNLAVTANLLRSPYSLGQLRRPAEHEHIGEKGVAMPVHSDDLIWCTVGIDALHPANGTPVVLDAALRAALVSALNKGAGGGG